MPTMDVIAEEASHLEQSQLSKSNFDPQLISKSQIFVYSQHSEDGEIYLEQDDEVCCFNSSQIGFDMRIGSFDNNIEYKLA